MDPWAVLWAVLLWCLCELWWTQVHISLRHMRGRGRTYTGFTSHCGLACISPNSDIEHLLMSLLTHIFEVTVPVSWLFFVFFNYILLIMLLQLPWFPLLCPPTSSSPTPSGNPPPLFMSLSHVDEFFDCSISYTALYFFIFIYFLFFLMWFFIF